MAKTVAMDFRSFVRNECKEVKLANSKDIPIKLVKLGGGVFLALAPRSALAASTGDAVFGGLWPVVMGIVDWLVVGVFVFSGVSWMFGHRTKALELLIGGTAGYLLARHAVDVRDFLKSV